MSGLVMTGFGKWKILILLTGSIAASRRQAFKADLKRLAKSYGLKVKELNKARSRKARKRK